MTIYYGWYIVAISVVSLTLLLGSTFHSFGVFVLPVSEDLGLTRAETNTALILFSLGNAICAPVVGWMLDRLSIRRIMLACALLMGASFVALGRSHSSWASAIVLGAPLAFAVQGAGVLTATTLVARWFSVHRGRAMAIAIVGMSLGGILLPPLIAISIEHVGWRQTLVIVGCAVALTLLALVPIARDKPGPEDVESRTADVAAHTSSLAHEAAANAQPLKATSLLRMWPFWTLSVSTALLVIHDMPITVYEDYHRVFMMLAGVPAQRVKHQTWMGILSTAHGAYRAQQHDPGLRQPGHLIRQQTGQHIQHEATTGRRR